MKSEKEIFESIIGGKHQRHELDIYSHPESGFKNPTILAIAFEVEDLKKSKIEEVEVWRLNPSLRLELSLGGY
jgi:hypothetical protein